MVCGSDLTHSPKLKLILNQASSTMQHSMVKYFSFVVDAVAVKEDTILNHSCLFFSHISITIKKNVRKLVFHLASLLYIHNFGDSNQLDYI